MSFAFTSIQEVKLMPNLLPSELIEKHIYFLRGHKVMLDSDLAKLYGVETKVLIQAVKRNLERFPADFMFSLNNQEVILLRSQIVTSKTGHGGRRYIPYVFTEQGIAMLSSVLKSDRAIRVNIEIMRAFVRLRALLMSHKELSEKLTQMERKYDTQFKVVFDAIRQLMAPPSVSSKKPIGF